MSVKLYRIYKLVLIAMTAASVAYGISVESYWIPAGAIGLAVLITLYLRSRTKDVIADERDYEVGGHAARWAISIFSWLAVVAIIALYSQASFNPMFEVVAAVLAYSVCLLMLLYAFLYRYYDKIRYAKNKTIYVILGLLLVLVVVFAGARLFSGEDTWICEEGQWVEHGHPSHPAPTQPCSN